METITKDKCIKINGCFFPIMGQQRVKIKETTETFSLPIIESQSDYKWDIVALASRIVSPELYAEDEDVSETIELLHKRLSLINPNYEIDLAESIKRKRNYKEQTNE